MLGDSVTSVLGWLPKTIAIFGSEPAIYFVAVALVGAVAGVARRFVPMRKR
ncbi:hypothetical protein ACTHQ8_22680 [Lysinibacillus odysseyi]|uniref:hypothetical protein n=1 Tax=Lysinibacillus odysseyi TaxID=202611 RepID=UPI000B0E3262|nr:hypothetical protein [Lysinibacillus odysseyi]